MKVCILTTSFPRHPGDYAGNFVLQLAEALAEDGVEVQVVAPGERGLPQSQRFGQVSVERFSYFWPRRWQRVAYLGGIPSNLRRYRLAWLQLPFFLFFFILQSRRACRDCDVIHANWISAGLPGAILSRRFRKPLVLTVHGSDVNLQASNRILNSVRSFVLDRTDAVISVSNELATRLQTLCDGDDGLIRVIPNGVNLFVFGNNSSPHPGFAQRLVWTGRMGEEKGLRFLMEAMPLVLEEYPAASLTLVGDGPLRESLADQVERLGVASRVQFAGRVAHREVVRYLSRADLFVLPSLNEGLPLSLLEAMGTGLPVVAARVGGIPDVVVTEGERQNGILVPAADSVALATAICRVLGEPDTAKQMGKVGQALIRERFSWARIAEETMTVYAEVL